MARIKGGAVLISAVHPISGGQGGSGAWGWRGSPELLVPRRCMTGEAQIGALGVGLGGGLAGEVDRGMRNPLEWKARCCGGRSRVHGVEAARRSGITGGRCSGRAGAGFSRKRGLRTRARRDTP